MDLASAIFLLGFSADLASDLGGRRLFVERYRGLRTGFSGCCCCMEVAVRNLIACMVHAFMQWVGLVKPKDRERKEDGRVYGFSSIVGGGDSIGG